MKSTLVEMSQEMETSGGDDGGGGEGGDGGGDGGGGEGGGEEGEGGDDCVVVTTGAGIQGLRNYVLICHYLNQQL